MKKIFSKATSVLLVFTMLLGLGGWYPSNALDIKTDVPEGYAPIYTCEDLESIRNDPSGKYILMNNIEIPGGGVEEYGISYNFQSYDTFTGTLDGNGHTISNLFVYSSLFGQVYGTIRNLNVCAVVTSDGMDAGGIAGSLSGVIENCSFDGQVILYGDSGYSNEKIAVGGIAGEVSGDSIIRGCSNYGDVAVSYHEYQGGISEATACVGGIAGYWRATSSDELKNCSNYGNVILAADCAAAVGGVLGYGYGPWLGMNVSSCFNAGSLYVGQSEAVGGKTVAVGGVIGEAFGEDINYLYNLKNVYNIGYFDINSPAKLCLGGIAGSLTYATVSGAYNTGSVFHDSGAAIGGIAGCLDENSTLENVYFPDIYSSARADMELTDGRYTWEDLKWSFQNLANDQEYDYDAEEWRYTWNFSEDSSYPYPQLNENPYRAFRFGFGTEEDPYQVRNMQELNAVRYQLSAHYIMTQDITCTTDNNSFYSSGNTTHPVIITGYQPTWHPIGNYNTQSFKGKFDGGDHTIFGIHMRWKDEDYQSLMSEWSSKCYMGLFGSNDGVIQNLTVSNYIESESIFHYDPRLISTHYETTTIIGAIAGYNSGTIRHCENSTYNTSGIIVGGIVGENSGTIEQCVNESIVFGYMCSGGIAAYNHQIIRECANIGPALGKRGNFIYISQYLKQKAGGIAAENTSVIENCYNTAPMICETYNAISLQDAAGIANGGTIRNCYNIGQVNQPAYGKLGTGQPIGGQTVSNVYAWDFDGNGTNNCLRTVDEMKQEQTYAGFDFDNIWTISGESEYPFPVLRNVETVFIRRMNGCVITKKPSRHVFLPNEKLSTGIADGECIMYYTDGTSETKTFFELNGCVCKTDVEAQQLGYILDLETVGKHSVQVMATMYAGTFYYYDTFEAVSEKLPVGISVTSAPEKTSFYEGEELDVSGLEVTLSYNTEQFEKITDYTLSGFDSHKTGKQTINVTYVDFSDTFDVEVLEKNISSVKFTPPAKLDYVKDYESFDPTGGKLTLTYNNGTSEEIDLSTDMISGFDNTKLGKQILTVTYEGFTDTFEIEIIDFLPGDVDGDGTVTDKDVEYLMYHILFPESYPVRQNCDFNGDGSVNDKDAEYLLYHIIFPESYPLHN